MQKYDNVKHTCQSARLPTLQILHALVLERARSINGNTMMTDEGLCMQHMPVVQGVGAVNVVAILLSSGAAAVIVTAC
jgi:oligoribonuclease (3'-5' exoribonuclease)